MKRIFCATAVAFGLSLGLVACATPTPADYAREKPALDLQRYFNGDITAHGIFTDRSGKVVRRFTVLMKCQWKGDDGVLDEAFSYSDGKTDRRVWKVRSCPTASTPAPPAT